MFYFEDIRILRDHKNMVNRLNNCEQANYEKSLKTSDKQMEIITYLRDNEYFLLDKPRRIVVVHTTKDKFAVLDPYFAAINKPLPQVLIEASIVAVDDGLEKQLGIKWNGFEGTSGYNAPVGRTPTNDSFKDWIKYGGTWDVSTVQALLKAVETDNKSQILSRPRIITVTGKTSNIHVGDEIPYTSGTTMSDGGNTTSNVAFKEVCPI